ARRGPRPPPPRPGAAAAVGPRAGRTPPAPAPARSPAPARRARWRKGRGRGPGSCLEVKAGMGNGEWGMGNGEWGMDLPRPGNDNGPVSGAVFVQVGGNRRSPFPIPYSLAFSSVVALRQV